ncbi:MAG: SAF domain-containing protein [Clostridia bacterium]|jgi:hypothetical protein|nr:SAF domain-containing protein [Clostridia bacterium]
MNKPRLILILLGLTLALGSAYGMFRLTGQLEAAYPVVVAARDIKAAEEFGPDSVRVVSLPEKYILSSAVKNVSILSGQKARTEIYAGEQILPERIGPKTTLKPSANERLFFIPVKEVAMQKGQKVDVYLLYTPGKSGYAGAERLLAGKVVASVVSEGGHSVSAEKLAAGRSQSGIEIMLTHEEILLYLERQQYARDVLVRHGEEETG